MVDRVDAPSIVSVCPYCGCTADAPVTCARPFHTVVDDTVWGVGKLVTSYNDLSSAISYLFDGDWKYVGRVNAKEEAERRLRSLLDEATRAVDAITRS